MYYFTDEYLTGVELVDEEHKELFRIAYYGKRAERIRANGAVLRSKRRKPSMLPWIPHVFTV